MRRIIILIVFLAVVWLPSRTCLSYQYAYRHYTGEIEWAVNDVGILDSINVFDAGDKNLVIYKQDYSQFPNKDILAVQINILGDYSQIITDFGGADVIYETGGWDPQVFNDVGDYWHAYGPELSSEVRISKDNEGRIVPEPATMILLGSGLIGLAGFRKRFKK